MLAWEASMEVIELRRRPDEDDEFEDDGFTFDDDDEDVEPFPPPHPANTNARITPATHFAYCTRVHEAVLLAIEVNNIVHLLFLFW